MSAQNVRKDFVSGVLSEEELGQQLYVHELHRDYAASVLNFRSYDAISRDVLQVCLFQCQACHSCYLTVLAVLLTGVI